MRQRRRTLLIISQVYVPDPASVGQHMADVAAAMVRRGYRVVVLTSARGYDDPSVRYPRREVRDGVEVVRLPAASFGKRSILVRLVGGLSFVLQVVARSFGIRHIDAILVSTSPPLASLSALAISYLRDAAISYWVMDLNPDQAIALGAVKRNSLGVWAFDWLNRRILGRAQSIIVLDRFMAEKVAAKRDVDAKLSIIAPWAHEEHLGEVPRNENPFLLEHGLNDKFVVMYSGNHSPANPLRTVLQAAVRLQDDSRLAFVFVGGGSGKKEVEETESTNVRSLPYQPLEQLRYSLAAADVHLVTLGTAMVGIIHPCKVYGAMAASRPIAFVGPEESHVTDILRGDQIGWSVLHGDVDGAVKLFRRLAAMDATQLAERGARARELVIKGFGKRVLCERMCDIVERSIGARAA